MASSPHPLALRIGRRRFVLQRDPTKCGVVYRRTVARAARMSTEKDALGQPPARRFEVPGFAMTMLDLDATPAMTRLGPLGAEDAIRDRPEVATTTPVFVWGDKRVVLSPQISVGFDPSRIDAAGIAAVTGLRLVRTGPDYVILALEDTANLLSVVQEISALPGVNYAEPDLVTIGRHIRPPASAARSFSAEPGPQAAFVNVFAPQAWQAAGSVAGVRIAVLDDGVDIQHPALAGAVVASFDAVNGSEQPIEPNGWDYHGTACAGVMTGLSKQPDFRGIAGGAKLLAVRIAQSPAQGQPWASSNSILRSGIDWAVANGADVLSNSWGCPPSTIVSDGVRAARENGRGGKGVVMVFAAGNSGGPVEFPATLEGTIAVGAVNLADEPKTFASSDGENWWASSTGPELTIAAPGVRVKTTDITGDIGRSPTDWRDDFNGTSAACPIVAGAAALVLSVAPGLTADEVTRALTGAADKVGSGGYDASGRNDFLGWGRLNVASALDRVRAGSRLVGRVTPLLLSNDIRLWFISAGAGESGLFVLEKDDADRLAQLSSAGTDVTIAYDTRVDSPVGSLLQGARLLTGSSLGSSVIGGSTSAPGGGDPPPDEVHLPRPGEDVFSTHAAGAGEAVAAVPRSTPPPLPQKVANPIPSRRSKR
ncbi:S8 family peptidase [Bradyrhizobium sp. HKCCYLS20291]|uniref:S8 family peptidase n=1 Tax=Bradyrhizobium sp. HKCCYLS20291 TaxID=3420766 RepID=UPI003EBD1B52